MKRLMICLMVGVFLLSGVAAAKEKGENPKGAAGTPAATPGTGMNCPLMQPGMGMMMARMGPGMWYNLGAASQLLSETMKEAAAVLASGKLSADDQKQLAASLKQLGQAIPAILYPKAGEKSEAGLKKLKDLEEALEKMEAKARGKK